MVILQENDEEARLPLNTPGLQGIQRGPVPSESVSSFRSPASTEGRITGGAWTPRSTDLSPRYLESKLKEVAN
jgi:hypothetical protein